MNSHKCALLFATLLCFLASSCTGAGEVQLANETFNLDFFQGDGPLESPRPTHEFIPTDTSFNPGENFEGVLTLKPSHAFTRIEGLTDTYGVIVNAKLKLRELPPFSFGFVTDGSDIIPLIRSPQRSDHPYWEMLPEPGVSWRQAGDKGWSHATLPFTLKEKNQNCTHNGLMTFMYKANGSITRAAWQITSETCLYLKINLWGIAGAKFDPQSIPRSAEVVVAYRKEKATRLPLMPFSALKEDHPDLDPTAFQPPGVDDVSVYGLVLNGVHYRSQCPGRFGPYPFCEVLGLPSYSLAKGMVGGLGYFLLSKRWPEFSTTPVADLVPECELADKRWNDVTPEQLVNMTTGNYSSPSFNADEDSDVMQTFFLAESHEDKVRFSCEAWPRKSPPANRWVYNTTNTYLLGVAMNTFLKQKLGPQADIYSDLIFKDLFKTLELSPLMQWTQRSYDKVSQPFTGFGLIFHPNDAAQIAHALNSESPLTKELAGTDFDSAMFRTGRPNHSRVDKKSLAYSHGFWGVDVSEWTACASETWVPFMSGYGGISIAMFPNEIVYYYFSDSNQHGFRNAAVEVNKFFNYCKEP